MIILKKLNGKKHYLISSVCISKNGDNDLESIQIKQFNNEKFFKQ